MMTSELIEGRKIQNEVKADLYKILRTLQAAEGDTSKMEAKVNDLLNDVEINLLAI